MCPGAAVPALSCARRRRRSQRAGALSRCRCPALSRCRCPGSVPVPLSRCCSRLILRRSYEEAVKPLDRARRGGPIASTAARCGGARPSLTTTTPTPARTRPAPVATWSRSTTEFPPPTRSGFRYQVSSGSRYVCPFSDPFQIRFRSVSDPFRCIKVTNAMFRLTKNNSGGSKQIVVMH